MGAKESNAGFVDLHNPTGLLLVGFAFLFFIAVMIAGAAFFKAGQAKDREERERLRDAQQTAKKSP